MKFSDIMGLLGGLALFLYGMQMMGSGLEAAAGNRMKQILGRSHRRCYYSGNSVLFGYYRHGGGLCKLRHDDAASSCLDHHGRQHWYHHYRPVNYT